MIKEENGQMNWNLETVRETADVKTEDQKKCLKTWVEKKGDYSQSKDPMVPCFQIN